MRDVAIYAPQAGDLYGRQAGERGGGGAELQTVLLARGLAARGFDVAHIVYPVKHPLPLEPPAPTLVERTPITWGVRPHPAREMVDVWRALTRAQARVVVVRGSGGYVVPAAAWCRAHRRSLVFAASNDLDFDLKRPDRHDAILRAYGLAARQAKRIVVQTEYQAQLARAMFPRVAATLIPSFAEAAEPVDGKPAYFLWSDRLTDYKRPEAFLDLAVALPEARFRMVASKTLETSPELLERIEARASELPNLELAPRCSRPELLAAMERAVAVVKTSRVEGMPNTFLEAWSRSLPVLSLSVDPDRRIAEHGVGLLADGSTERFAEQARRLWEDRELRAEIGARGRAFVVAHHSLAAVADRWATMLRGLLGRA
jgi:glycosyltransferase involved in cell wall biosynthesis